jgi:hypothetical protein
MADYYSVVTPDQGLKCSAKRYKALLDLIDESEAEDGLHGFDLKREGDTVYLEAEENGVAEELPAVFLVEFGKLIAANKLPFLEFGYSHSASRLMPGSTGGGYFRIYADGSLVFPVIRWPGDEQLCPVCNTMFKV